MRIKTVKLDDATRATLMRSTIEGNQLKLPGQLPRDEYMRVAKAIEAAGGKWNKKAGCHVFPDDVRQTLNLTADSVDVVNVQQTYQSFYTPPGLAGQVCEWADLMAGYSLLEPSAGEGALIKAAMMHGIFRSDITAVEIDAKKADKLGSLAGLVLHRDFLSINGFDDAEGFDRVLMNPPFSSGQDVKHILHALRFLNDGGRLVAICASGPRTRAALEPIASKWIDVEAGAFKESGTPVATAIVVIESRAQ